MQTAVITTYSGIHIDVLNPEDSDFSAEDIAHALSNICRFGGHCNRFYSVAQHSYYVSALLSPLHALAGLLHDATEAYLYDIPRPIKAVLPDYRIMELTLGAKIATAFGLPSSAFTLPEVVHADNLMLALEAGVLVSDPSAIYAALGRPDTTLFNLDSHFEPWSPVVARDRFLWRFRHILEAQNTGLVN